MKHLVLALCAVCLAFSVAACGGGGAASAGPVPSISVESASSGTSPGEASAESGPDRLTKAEYLAQAQAICFAATERFGAATAAMTVRDLGRWHRAAVRFSEEALGKLRALRPPVADLATVDREYSLSEQEIDVLRQVATASFAGDIARVEDLNDERIDLTHQRDLLRYLPGECPVSLPA